MTATQPPPLYDRNGSAGTYERMQSAMDQRSMGELMGDLSTHARDLFRGEVELVKAEATEKAKAAGKYAAMGAAAAVLGLVSLVFLGHVIALALDTFMPQWTAYLITFALFVVAAAALGITAKNGFAKGNLAPTDSIDQAKEDLSWIARHR